jgi:DtxR family Mn-dependent transcriptional regulator
MAERVSVSPSVEDYAKAVCVLETRTGGAVSTNILAERLEITPGSASGMVRKLADQGLVEHERYRGVRPTDAGRTLALSVIRRHRLITLIFMIMLANDRELMGERWVNSRCRARS